MSGQADGFEFERSSGWAEFIDRVRARHEDRPPIPFPLMVAKWQDGSLTMKVGCDEHRR